ncbi:MAG: hypothetical protein PHS46_08415 [Candidatus Omnitrophica bacterium]|nr:hypothetical protein [Candidatus Omnitrophota bacterium]
MKNLILALLLLGLVSNAVNIASCPYQINSSGSYVVTGNLATTGNCLTINNAVTGVTINLNGKTLSGDSGSSDYGVRLFSGAGQVILENGTITGFGVGVRAGTGAHDQVQIRNITFTSNGIGIYNAADNTATGFLIQNNTITGSSSEGILMKVTAGTPTVGNNTITQNTITNNAGNGQIVIGNLYKANVSYNNITGAKTGTAIWTTSTAVNLTGNTYYNITQVGESAIYFQSGSTSSIFDNNFFYNCTIPFNVVPATQFNRTAIGYNSTIGIANFTAFSITNDGMTAGTDFYAQPTFFSTNLAALNTNASLKLATDGACANTTVYTKSGLPSSAADIIANGIPANITASCASGVADFNVTGFSGYALDAPPATGITLIAPSNGAVLSGTGTSLQYNLTTYDAVTCNTTLDGSVIDSQSFAVSQMVNVTATASTGSHLWYVRCYLNANPAYYKTSATYSFSMSFSTYENSINLSTTVENVLDSPQSLFYDSTGNLNLLYFIDDTPTDAIHIATVANGAITQNYTQAFNATKSFFAAFRNGTDTIILTFNTDNITKHYIILNSTSMTIQNASTTYNVTPNVQYDPYAYANTKNIQTITNQTGSHYLFILPTTTDSRLIRMNYSLTTFQDLNTTNHNRKVTWGTIAKNANLTTWYYAWLSNASCNATSDRIQIWSYNSTTQVVNATPDTTCYGQADIEGSQVIFEQYGNNTYALISNITNRTVIHMIEENKTYLFNYTVSEHSPLIFLDEDTLIFFSREGTATYAYSCYFASTPACIRYSASDYGATVPFYSGNMTTAKRSGSSDVNAVGKVTNWDRLKLLYSEKTYDTKFICYDEMDEYRKAFTVQVFTQNTSQILKTPPSYGYALPSDMIGSGRKRAYFNCENGTLRLFLVGLNNNFTINSYSLDNTSGAYYTFTIEDAYGQPIQNITVTAQRFSNLAQSYVTIEQGVSDYTGSVTLFLELFALYQVTIDANGYVPITFEFVPSGTYTVEIALATSNGTVITLPTYNRVFNDVSYSIAPNNGSFFEPSENLSYHVVSSNATLEYYGMEITKKHNGTTTTIYSVNTTTSPSGGLMEIQANDTGVYTVSTWFKAQNYSEYRPNPRIYYLGNATGLAGVRETLEGNALISGWFYYLIAVGVTMLAAGFVSKYSTEGAGAVGLIVLWGFTMLYPHGIIFVAGSVGITIWMATVFTTLMVAAGFYIMKQGV